MVVQLEMELATGDTRRSNSLREPLPGPAPKGGYLVLWSDSDGPLTGPFVVTLTIPAAEGRFFLSFRFDSASGGPSLEVQMHGRHGAGFGILSLFDFSTVKLILP
jgi:hypothetical protein